MIHRTAAALITGIGLAGGCAPVNEEVGLLGAPPLPALEPGTETERVTSAAGPSIEGHDRRLWDRQTVIVPLRQVEHRPHYASHVHMTDSTARQRGAYPTVVSALEVPTNEWAHVAEGVIAPVHAVALIAWWPFDWALNDRPPWAIERGPAIDYAPAPDLPAPDTARWLDVAGH